MPELIVTPRNFMDMLAALAAKHDMLYDSFFICEAVFRSLPPLGKKYALQMVYVSAPVAATGFEEWVIDEYKPTKHKVAIDRLLQLGVFVEVRDGQEQISKSMPSNNGNTSCCNQSTHPKLLQRGLMRRDGAAPKLTEKGLHFLLMETNAQLWYIVREYISSADERGVDSTELISFLLELGTLGVGAAYSLDPLTNAQSIAIKDLAELGLVKLIILTIHESQSRKDSRFFIPTKLATNLSPNLSDTSSSKEGFVVVETNFRIYAHSTSKLHCEILCLFSSVEYQLPNLIVGAITKESIYSAFEDGITAEQIISFLQQNAHPRVADKIPPVPDNVTDQIRLWETDRNRVEMIPSHLYEEDYL
ncbi:hypothetical protein PR202_gb25432 [Eleusine coracana subsp. coracana]|uniref:RNA polymerase II transcription factor B subunit 2 n=1 Tax=Eleusine coracana subsp. coracana TaxID=191504 RepID=A0AAV5FNY7_ELECO|nr:hypothetical protein PR202_gb25432 [Eleusine coracana subsp. coracana]